MSVLNYIRMISIECLYTIIIATADAAVAVRSYKNPIGPEYDHLISNYFSFFVSDLLPVKSYRASTYTRKPHLNWSFFTQMSHKRQMH